MPKRGSKSAVKRTQIAAARVQVAIAERRGNHVEDWLRELAQTPLSDVKLEAWQATPARTPNWFCRCARFAR